MKGEKMCVVNPHNLMEYFIMLFPYSNREIIHLPPQVLSLSPFVKQPRFKRAPSNFQAPNYTRYINHLDIFKEMYLSSSAFSVQSLN